MEGRSAMAHRVVSGGFADRTEDQHQEDLCAHPREPVSQP